MLDNFAIFKNFQGKVAIYAFLGRKVERYAGEFLDTIGPKNLITCIEQGIWLSDRIPEEEKIALKMKAMEYQKIIGELDPTLVYSWLPARHKTFFKSVPNGEAWAMQQLRIIKDYLCS